jgi:hypothetical protein
MTQHQLLQFVADLLPSWRKTRRTVLALGTLALIHRRQLTLTGIARGLDNHSRVIHRVKRIWRFLANRAVDPRQVVGALAGQAFRLRPEGWVPVIFDETGLKDRAMLLGAGPWYRGRALVPGPGLALSVVCLPKSEDQEKPVGLSRRAAERN